MRTTLVAVAVLFLFQYIYLKSGWYISKKYIAIKGHDPVGYFSKNRAIQGIDKFSLIWNNKLWRFSHLTNLELFKATPEKYAPQYNGNCAYGCSEGRLANASPKAWTIMDGKLYFNYNKKVRMMWMQEAAKRINAADAYWAKVAI